MGRKPNYLTEKEYKQLMRGLLKTEDRINRLVEYYNNHYIAKAFIKVHNEILEEAKETLVEIYHLKNRKPEVNLSTTRRYVEMDKQIAKILEKFFNEQQSLFREILENTYNETIQGVDREIIKNGGRVLVDFKKPNIAHLNKVLTEINNYFMRASEGIDKRIKQTINNLVNDQVNKQILTGQDLRRATKDLVKKMEKSGIKFVTTSKRHYDLHTYAKMIIRTESRYMHTQATIDRTRDNGYYYVRISSHSNPSKACEPHQGKIFFIGRDKRDNWLNKPTLESVSGVSKLFHPNCKHIAVPYPKRKPTR